MHLTLFREQDLTLFREQDLTLFREQDFTHYCHLGAGCYLILTFNSFKVLAVILSRAMPTLQTDGMHLTLFREQDPWQLHVMQVSSSLVATGLLVYSGKNIRPSLSHCQPNGVSIQSGSRSIHSRHCWSTHRPCWKAVSSVAGRHSGLIFPDMHCLL